MEKFLITLNLLVMSTTCFATANFTSSDGNHVIPDVSVDGNKNYDSVTLQLDMSNGTFRIIDAIPKNTTISVTPLQTELVIDKYKIDFFGCERSEYNQITCHVDVTSGSDSWFETSDYSFLYDNQSREYKATSVIVFDKVLTNPGQNLIQGIPVRVKYIFNDFDIHATSISVFKPLFGELDSYGGDVTKYHELNFRNINF